MLTSWSRLLDGKRRAWLVAAAGLVAGALVWLLSPWLTGMREPFDSATLYYPVAIFLAGAGAALFGPRHAWIAVPAVFAGEQLFAIIAYDDLRAWFPFSLLINLVIPTWWPAALGALTVYAADRMRPRPA